MAKKIFIVLFTALLAIMELDGLPIIPQDNVEMVTAEWDTPLQLCNYKKTTIGGDIWCHKNYYDKKLGNYKMSYGNDIMNECCDNSCTPLYILSYCAREGVNIQPLVPDNIVSVSTTTTPAPVTTKPTITCKDDSWTSRCHYWNVLPKLITNFSKW